MWKYIITWCLSIYVTDPCPDMFKKDEFDRMSMYYSCDVLHGHYEKDCDHKKEIWNRAEAMSFYERAKKGKNQISFNPIFGQQIVDVKLDSVYIDTNFRKTDVKKGSR